LRCERVGCPIAKIARLFGNSSSCKIIYWETASMIDEEPQSRRRRNTWRQSCRKKSRSTKTRRNRALAAGAVTDGSGSILGTRFFEKMSGSGMPSPGEETLVCKETALGDLRIWCAARKSNR